MTEYICKCGRTVRKSTNTETTGNRDTDDCRGCPYRMAWGPMQWNEDRHAYVAEVKGHECRMSQYLNYASELHGNLDDKTVLSLYSLDFDFLDKVCRWMKDTYPDKEIEAYFDRNRIRTSEYSGCGRYRLAICCAGNRKGVAAKKALAAKFFTSKGHRKDMPPDQEKEKILNDIQNGLNPAPKEEPVCPASAAPTTASSAPALPADAGLAEPALTAAPPAPLAAASTMAMADRPSFDYSGLDQSTVDTMHLAEQEIRDAKQIYIVRVSNAVAMVHEAVVANCDNGADGKFTAHEKTFTAWCAYMGISRDAAYRFLQVDRLLSGASPEELATLEAASPSLLYAAAKPSAPAQLVEQVKSGDITTHKQYQELLAELRRKDADISQLADQCQQAEAERDEAKHRAAEARTREEEARAAAHHYHLKADEAEAQRNAYLDREGEHLARIAELEARPIEVAVQQPGEADLARYRAEGAETARRELTAQIASADAARKKTEDKLKKLQETLQGRTDHLNAVEAELAALKKQMKAQAAAARTVQAVPCSQCVYESDCCGLTFLDNLVGEDEDDINDRLNGCTAGKRREG